MFTSLARRLPGRRAASFRRPSRWRPLVAGASAVALLGGIVAVQGGPLGAGASSHREAPLIAGDPRADNTDVYAFVSPDSPDTVTLISAWLPFSEPDGGPNFYTWADDTRYTIKIDNNGDAIADLTYVWVFDTVIRDADDQFLTTTGTVTSLDDPDLNVYQTYDLTLEVRDGPTIPLLGNGDGVHTPGDPIAAPSMVGPASMPDYTPLRNQAIRSIPGGGQTWAGQADDPFFLDLRVFDLLYGGDASLVGQDTLAGYNVNAVALQLPKSALAIDGDAANNPVIGIWSTTERRSAQSLVDSPAPADTFVQVSRLGNPLINEVVIPLALKDAFNAISPDQDAGIPAVVDKVLDPILPKLVESIYGVPAPSGNRNDLFEIFLQGISEANAGADGDPDTLLPVNLNSQDLNEDAQSSRGAGVDFRPSEMLRLNMGVAPTANPNNFGVIAGDIAGFPNGRRLEDDVVDIAIQVMMGAAITGELNPALLPLDSVDRNDKEFGSTFPYLALPHSDAVNRGVDRSPQAPTTPGGSEYVALNPERILDTRSGARPAAGQTLTLQVTGVGSSQVPDDARAVFLNVTAAGTASNGFVTVYPCDAPRPLASNFNPIAGRPTTVLVAAKLSASGTVCLYTSAPTHLIADINGFHPGTATYTSTQPVRLLDTRNGTRPSGGQSIAVKVTGVGNPTVPGDAKAAMLSVTTTGASESGFVTVYPCGEAIPNASNVNFVPGLSRANLVAAKIGSGGTVCLFVNKSTEVIVDLAGFAPAASPFVSTSPERVLDTRPGMMVSYSGQKPNGGRTIELKVTGFGDTQIPANAEAVVLNLTATESVPPGYATVYPCGSTRPLASNLNYTNSSTPNMVVAKIGEGGRVCIFTFSETHLVADINGYFP